MFIFQDNLKHYSLTDVRTSLHFPLRFHGSFLSALSVSVMNHLLNGNPDTRLDPGSDAEF